MRAMSAVRTRGGPAAGASPASAGHQLGAVNKSRFLPRTWRTWRELIPREEDVGSPGEETVEDLLGLVCSPHSPWALLEGSSAEDRFLRQLAIQNPLMLKDTFFYSYFRSLHVVDKEVRLVDKDLLKFRNLEELVLSANQIQKVDAVNLPPTLKVLELYGNSVASMACLCAHPPPGLQHLGLGHNKLLGPLQSHYVTREHWPHLVSLDLGFNDLTDLQGMVGSLSSLRHLRLLVLQGNPLALVPYYRGLTVDSLARLCVLDDITVSPSEKHQFRGISHSGDFLPREAQLLVTIGNVRGVLDSSILDPEPGPQGPFITYTYYVTYDFVEDEEGEGSELVGVLAEVAEIVKPSPSVEQLEAVPAEDIPGEHVPEEAEDVAESVPTTASQSGELESVVSGGSVALPRSTDSAEELAKLRPRIDPRLCPSPGAPRPRPWSWTMTPRFHLPSQDGPLQHRPQALGQRHPLQLRDAAHAQGPGASQGLPAGGDHRDHRGGEDPVLASGGPSRRRPPACQERERGKGQEGGEEQDGEGRERQGSERRDGGTQGLQKEERPAQGAAPGPARPAGAGQGHGGPGAPADGGAARVHCLQLWGDPHRGIRQADVSQGFKE
ncbi:leucine-rich repeat-containing protein 43 isoform X3 [Pteropus alecto]|uniref:leucine-rich repeat-containing protein 43 isoform X3 n=1 Tax=Pteropus alecto TaxID=9402 RepID=UPI000D5347EC|nr:leucine-rich repeat-containing protein 43 isoform X3 [Pteropus alecto]